jgi:hypothetical protein
MDRPDTGQFPGTKKDTCSHLITFELGQDLKN